MTVTSELVVLVVFGIPSVRYRLRHIHKFAIMDQCDQKLYSFFFANVLIQLGPT